MSISGGLLQANCCEPHERHSDAVRNKNTKKGLRVCAARPGTAAQSDSPSLLLILVLKELLDFLRFPEVGDRGGSLVVKAEPNLLTDLQQAE